MISGKTRPNNSSRRFLWLAVAILVLLCGYVAAWFYLADRLESRANVIVSGMSKGGASAQCTNLSVRGFPFRLGVFCDNLHYADEGRELFVSAGSLRSAAQLYQPAKVVGELDSPLRISTPGLPPLWIGWDNLRGSVRLARPLPELVSVEAMDLSVITDPEDTEPESLLSAARAVVHLRPNGADVDWAASFEGLEVDPVLAGGRTLPVMNGAADIGIKDGVAMLRSHVNSLRGRSVEIRNLDLSSGEGGVVVNGPVSVADDGLVDARLTVRIRKPDAVSELLAGVFPEERKRIATGFAGLALLGNEPAMPLVISRGTVTLGFIRLGDIPPLQ